MGFHRPLGGPDFRLAILAVARFRRLWDENWTIIAARCSLGIPPEILGGQAWFLVRLVGDWSGKPTLKDCIGVSGFFGLASIGAMTLLVSVWIGATMHQRQKVSRTRQLLSVEREPLQNSRGMESMAAALERGSSPVE